MIGSIVQLLSTGGIFAMVFGALLGEHRVMAVGAVCGVLGISIACVVDRVAPSEEVYR